MLDRPAQKIAWLRLKKPRLEVFMGMVVGSLNHVSWRAGG